MHTMIKRLREQRELHAVLTSHLAELEKESRVLVREEMERHPDRNHASGNMALGYLNSVAHHQQQTLARLDDAIIEMECQAVAIDMRDETDDAIEMELQRMAMERGGYDRDVNGRKVA